MRRLRKAEGKVLGRLIGSTGCRLKLGWNYRTLARGQARTRRHVELAPNWRQAWLRYHARSSLKVPKLQSRQRVGLSPTALSWCNGQETAPLRHLPRRTRDGGPGVVVGLRAVLSQARHLARRLMQAPVTQWVGFRSRLRLTTHNYETRLRRGPATAGNS